MRFFSMGQVRTNTHTAIRHWHDTMLERRVCEKIYERTYDAR
jgi:hypothetical protein